ncbi:MAG: hypothetical protein Q8L24_02875 [bacterium]|nr:hypothetical protein [bacterium]
MTVATGLAIWAVCGFLAYGLDKGRYRDFLRKNKLRVSDFHQSYLDEARYICIALMGPAWPIAIVFGLLANFLFCGEWQFWRRLSFCLRMPKNLK